MSARSEQRTVIVIAKTPEPGRVKTRLCPPCTPEEAAMLAAAALDDTFTAVAAMPEVRRVLVLSGAPGAWIPPGFEVIPQRGAGLDERLAAAFTDVMDANREPTLLIGMDTPQVTASVLWDALAELATPGTDAVLAPAVDGGWWAVGLKRPEPAAFLGVPMSTPHTWRAQHRRLRSLGLRVADLPVLVDVDDIETATAVAASAPSSRFAATLRALDLEAGSPLATAR